MINIKLNNNLVMLYSKILFSCTSIFFGLIFGSFLNVVIYRLPNNQSILTPRSFCPKCNKKLSWHENIPIYSWIKLKGKCSNCDKAISTKYPLTELATGMLFLFSFNAIPKDIYFENFAFNLFFSWALILILLSISIIDYEFLWIPNSIIMIGFLFGLASSIFSAIVNDQNIVIQLFVNLISGILGFLIIILIMKSGELVFKKPSMGLGDAKLAGMIGFWIGLPGVIISIWLSFIISGLFVILGLATKKIKKGQLIPFGPFLSISGFLIWLFGEDIFLKIIFQ
ncbi:type 4 prepilin peptidase 1, Aspartic peptidase, MEROPS family A24A [Prochlorococcus marinus str. MIT 9312]|uniref:Type 4 prepilin peptidase 1, Aspartic peptidase, MEROPS family A24A n=1 Tax=Prochlorococcus marinus (strain MIT 9312) TaxID=74546 RepID=Q31A50_PROM9|nr:A24 family peptidase [Prochlorococcus marinus]ABB50245.1 type 4 prepilin peptidase 1, Aspartic peptidase, MEROPS family A24A [Prochlorococcus marinus str. MIT 9312]KGF99813.1 Leader peptidase (Prepilin peptidase) [Prochlorococcus marinus str. MIT 9311]